jgi:Zn-dependent M16 (insulinase) family peptidase
MFKKIFQNKILNIKTFTQNTSLDITSVNKKDLEKLHLRGKNRPAYNFQQKQEIHGFSLQKILNFDEFEMKGYILEHLKTGAKYYHIDSSDVNNGFAIHFSTPAFDNTGVFHILEHLALCGSKKYPVRDPFMNMLKRSLNSYMNAWTGPDFTMYPFAAQNIKDFNNLRDVYTDATFNPKLDYLDFLQEGWRYEFLEPSNMKSSLTYKGVVLNEMKGAMSQQDSYFIQKLQSNLYTDSTYKYNSGGDPRYIPTLRYEDLVETHRKFYHPSNTKFITYGDMNFTDNLEFLDEVVLRDRERSANKILVPRTKRFDKPREVIDFYQPEMGLGNADVAKMAISFLCTDNTEDTYETFKL